MSMEAVAKGFIGPEKIGVEIQEASKEA